MVETKPDGTKIWYPKGCHGGLLHPPPADYDPHKPLTVERNPAIPVVTFRKPDGTPMAMARPHTPPQAAQPKPLPRDAPVEFQSSLQTPMAPLMLGKDKATWLELSTGEKAAAIQLGYHETLWNTGGAPRDVYKVHWNELDEIKLKAAKDLGYNEESWEEDAFLSENEEEGSDV